MSYWNHRLVKDVESGRLAIHEVYYDDMDEGSFGIYEYITTQRTQTSCG